MIVVVVVVVLVVLVDKAVVGAVVVLVKFEARGVVRPASAKIARIEPLRLDALCSHGTNQR